VRVCIRCLPEGASPSSSIFPLTGNEDTPFFFWSHFQDAAPSLQVLLGWHSAFLLITDGFPRFHSVPIPQTTGKFGGLFSPFYPVLPSGLIRPFRPLPLPTCLSPPLLGEAQRGLCGVTHLFFSIGCFFWTSMRLVSLCSFPFFSWRETIPARRLSSSHISFGLGVTGNSLLLPESFF